MSTDDELPTRRPLLGVFFLSAPIVGITLVFFGYLAVIWNGMEGKAAAGEVRRITFATCPEAEPILRARVDDMGLGEPRWETVDGGLAVVARMPEDARVAAAIPGTLATTGAFEVRDDDGGVILSNTDLVSATPFIGLRPDPRTLLELTEPAGKRLRKHMEAHPAGSVHYVLDGEVIQHRKNLPAETTGHVELEVFEASELQRLEVVAHRAIVLDDGPLPCPTSVVSSEPAGPSRG